MPLEDLLSCKNASKKRAYGRMIAAARSSVAIEVPQFETFPLLNNTSVKTATPTDNTQEPQPSTSQASNHAAHQPSIHVKVTKHQPFRNPWAQPTKVKITTEERAAKRKRPNRIAPGGDPTQPRSTQRNPILQSNSQPPPGFAHIPRRTPTTHASHFSTSLIPEIVDFLCNKFELPPIWVAAVKALIIPFLQNQLSQFIGQSPNLLSAAQPTSQNV